MMYIFYRRDSSSNGTNVVMDSIYERNSDVLAYFTSQPTDSTARLLDHNNQTTDSSAQLVETVGYSTISRTSEYATAAESIAQLINTLSSVSPESDSLQNNETEVFTDNEQSKVIFKI